MSEWRLIDKDWHVGSAEPPHALEVLLGWWDWRGEWRYEAGAYSSGFARTSRGFSNLSLHGQATHWTHLPLPPDQPKADKE